MLPESLISPLQEDLSNVKRLHAQDVLQGVAPVYLPFALERKYPHAGRLSRQERYAQGAGPHQHVSVRERRWTGMLRGTRQLHTRGDEPPAWRCQTQQRSLVSLGATKTLPMPNPVDLRPGHDGSWGLSRGMSPSTTGGMIVTFSWLHDAPVGVARGRRASLR
jgi:hypothetical protein